MMQKIKIDFAQIKQLPVTHSAAIPEEYLDAMGHMNVMWYTHLFSVAMGGMFQLIGLTWEHLEKCRGGSFALEAHIRYLSEVRVGQAIHVHTRLLGRSQKRYHVLHTMLNEHKQDVAATFEAVGAYIDMQQRRMAPFPTEIAQRLDQLIEQHQALPWPAATCGVMLP